MQRNALRWSGAMLAVMFVCVTIGVVIVRALLWPEPVVSGDLKNHKELQQTGVYQLPSNQTRLALSRELIYSDWVRQPTDTHTGCLGI
jgi:hypothetical protein